MGCAQKSWTDTDRRIREVERRIANLTDSLALEEASGFRPDVVDGRFVIETRFRGRRWEVVGEPDEVEHLLVVVSAYGVEPTSKTQRV